MEEMSSYRVSTAGNLLGGCCGKVANICEEIEDSTYAKAKRPCNFQRSDRSPDFIQDVGGVRPSAPFSPLRKIIKELLTHYRNSEP